MDGICDDDFAIEAEIGVEIGGFEGLEEVDEGGIADVLGEICEGETAIGEEIGGG